MVPSIQHLIFAPDITPAAARNLTLQPAIPTAELRSTWKSIGYLHNRGQQVFRRSLPGRSEGESVVVGLYAIRGVRFLPRLHRPTEKNSTTQEGGCSQVYGPLGRSKSSPLSIGGVFVQCGMYTEARTTRGWVRNTIFLKVYTRVIQWVSNRLPHPTYRSPLGTRWYMID